MSFVAGYDKLEAVLAANQGLEVATLGDVFRPNRQMPDLGVQIGSKIERAVKLIVPYGTGELAVAVTCHVIKPDEEMCEGIVPMGYFSTRTYEPKPAMVTKQTVEWVDGSANHHTRLFTGFSKPNLERDDLDRQTYERKLSVWEAMHVDLRSENIRPFKPTALMYNMDSDFPLTCNGNPEGPTNPDPRCQVDLFYDDLAIHFTVLRKVALTMPALGHLAAEGRYGKDMVTSQSPEQFENYVDWLLSPRSLAT